MYSMSRPNLFNRFFISCSGASLPYLVRCPDFEQKKYISIGITIFFTTLLAFISSYYALSLIFDSQVYILALSLFWALIIFNLDRYIVQSIRSDQSFIQKCVLSIPRLIIASLVAVVISKPIEIKLFENEINNFLLKEKAIGIETIEKKYALALSIVNKRKADINSSFDQKLQIRDQFYQDYMCECNGTCGTGVKGRGIECSERKKKYEEYALEIQQLKAENKLSLSSIDNEIKDITQQFNESINKYEATMVFGFFDRIRALNQIENLAAYFIMFIFIMIETAPLFTKLFSTTGPYDHLVLQSLNKYEAAFYTEKDQNDLERKKLNAISQLNFTQDLKEEENKLKDKLRKKVIAQYDKIRIEHSKKRTG